MTYALVPPSGNACSAELERVRKTPLELPCLIGGEKVYTGKTIPFAFPTMRHVSWKCTSCRPRELEAAVEKRSQGWKDGPPTPWYQRAAVFQRAADMLATVRRTEHIAAIMTNLSKTPVEAEIDLAELVDFCASTSLPPRDLSGQPLQGQGRSTASTGAPGRVHRRRHSFQLLLHRGKICRQPPPCAATSSSGKPAKKSVLYANYLIMELLLERDCRRECELTFPFSSADGATVLRHPLQSGLHFTGTMQPFSRCGRPSLLRRTLSLLSPRGGGDGRKGFSSSPTRRRIPSPWERIFCAADSNLQGQKCSAASRPIFPRASEQRGGYLRREVPLISMGPVEDLAMPWEPSSTRRPSARSRVYLDYARNHPRNTALLLGGGCDDRKGWFVEPTVIRTSNPRGKLKTEEIFGPVITVYVYPTTPTRKRSASATPPRNTLSRSRLPPGTAPPSPPANSPPARRGQFLHQ